MAAGDNLNNSPMVGKPGCLANPLNKTVLEKAFIPNLDKLASKSTCGLTDPISCGITPGSGPAHLSLFGYDPIKYQIGRGVLEALGIGMELTSDDLACRGNFATMDESGIITDRRAGRIPTELNEKICRIMQDKISQIKGTKIIIKPGMEHRFVVVFRGKGLEEGLSDADPQVVGKKLKYTEPLRPEAGKTAEIINEFIDKAIEVLKEHSPANAVLLRGFAKHPGLPTMSELFKLSPAAIATNGVKTLEMVKGAHRIIIGSFLNLQAVCNYCANYNGNILIICAGKEGRFSLEDTACAGMFIDSLKDALSDTCQGSDANLTARLLYEKFGNNILEILRKSQPSF